MFRAGLALAALSLACVPATALGAEVGVFSFKDNREACRDTGTCEILHDVFYAAAKGEVNALSFTQEGTVLRFHDDGAALKVRAGCKAVDAHEATCTVADNLELVDIGLGNRDDSATLTTTSVGAHVTGGTGDDTINGGAGDDFLGGSEGADTISGGAGDDMLDDGLNTKGRLYPDSLDGGEGRDRLNWNDRSKRLFANLGDPNAPAGEAGEGDRLRSIEILSGGDGNDVLLGSPARDEINGNAGNDVIRGLGGDDWLMGSLGRDRLYGSAGRDTLEGEEGRDRIVGGCGRDNLDGGWGSDRIFAVDGGRDFVSGGSVGGPHERDYAAVDAGLDKVDAIEQLRKQPPPQALC